VYGKMERWTGRPHYTCIGSAGVLRLWGLHVCVRRGVAGALWREITSLLDAPVGAAALPLLWSLYSILPSPEATRLFAAYLCTLCKSSGRRRQSNVAVLKVSCWPFVWVAGPPTRLEPQAKEP